MFKSAYFIVAAVAAVSFVSVAGAAPLLFTGFSENFNSMGTSGTTPPAGFSMKTGNSGTTNGTWTTTTGIPASGTNSVASMINASTPLTATSVYPTAQNNNGYNAPAYNGATPTAADRALGTSPTTVSGGAIELSLTNNTTFAQTGLTVSYDIERFSAATTANELPGYWLFYSLGSNVWTEATSFRSTIATVPNTVGSANVSGTLTFSSPLAVGSTVLLRWVDDNAAQTSPDQVIGLDNVVINPTVVPEPAAMGLLLPAGLVLVSRRRR